MNSEALLALLQTPHKHGRLVIAPSYCPGDFDSHMVDCPFPFRLHGRTYMTYIGWDSRGYRTGLAISDDLVHWTKLGLILDRGGFPTEFNAALTSILRDNELFGTAELKPVNGRFIGTYHAYPAAGYESGPACIGLCTSTDLFHWEVAPPILRADDPDAAPWEQGGLYKSWLMAHAGTYYLFYNAKNKARDDWIEQTGFATSTNLVRWQRHPHNPILPVGAAGTPPRFDDLFASDPVILRHDNTWLLFYFGNSTDGHARDSVAFSPDLHLWQKSGAILIDVGPPGSLDSKYAHKPGIITQDNRLYHFYCGVRPATPADKLETLSLTEVRGITLATN